MPAPVAEMVIVETMAADATERTDMEATVKDTCEIRNMEGRCRADCAAGRDYLLHMVKDRAGLSCIERNTMTEYIETAPGGLELFTSWAFAGEDFDFQEEEINLVDALGSPRQLWIKVKTGRVRHIDQTAN